MSLEDITEDQFGQIEREFFVGFYGIRKLFEAPAKLSQVTRRQLLDVVYFDRLDNTDLVDWYNRSEFWEHYNIEFPKRERRDVLYVAHRVTHSFIFMLGEEEFGSGIYFTSDRDKESRLNFITTSEVARIFRQVGSDYPENLKMWRDDVTGEMKVEAK
ncbi:hypothetical protein VCJ71_04870 [Alteriqipengyuania sp. WL0013]|uniref:hypothetical protein n=1 Tax=Alteriqipengyuania sp. WL0013 TaxID=3110773 RepID=UPI002D097C50|nr:hypothetical protein [Alteriqipengyuania sp. WL0013]MEB3415389.1 hypothetical protein [Alteriqipengyuania sp. WL0013]